MSQEKKIQLSKHSAQCWSNATDGQNFLQNQSFLQNHVVDFSAMSLKENNWIFSHIPKTAGTSCENYLAQMFLIQDILHINAADLNQCPQLLCLKNQFPRFIAGHHPLHGLLYQLLPEQKFVHLTVLREPVARVLSYFNYLKSRNTHALHHSVANMDFDEFLQQPLVELHNGQARRLTGLLHSDVAITDMNLFEAAKLVIDQCFTLVGVVEKLDAFLQVIEQKCYTKIVRHARKNTSTITLSTKQIKTNQLKILHRNNTADIMLYEYVLEKFTHLHSTVMGNANV